MDSQKSSGDSGLREIFKMGQLLKQQMSAVDDRLARARRAAYFPIELSSDEEKNPKKGRFDEMSTLERRLLHDRDRKQSATTRAQCNDSGLDNDFVNYNRATSSGCYQDSSFNASSLPYYVDWPFEFRPSASPTAIQSRSFTSGEILGTRSSGANIDQNHQLSSNRSSTSNNRFSRHPASVSDQGNQSISQPSTRHSSYDRQPASRQSSISNNRSSGPKSIDNRTANGRSSRDRLSSSGDSCDESGNRYLKKNTSASLPVRSDRIGRVEVIDRISENKMPSTISSPKKQQRRLISPPRHRKLRQSPPKRLDDRESIDQNQQVSIDQNRKIRNYDVSAIRAYMERKRKERKQPQKKEENAPIDKKRTTHAYGGEEIQEYIQKRKSIEQQNRKRAVERMQAAKLGQQKRLQELLEEQKKRKRIPVANLLNGGLSIGVAKTEATLKVCPKKAEDDYERRVNTIRSKYNFVNHEPRFISGPDVVSQTIGSSSYIESQSSRPFRPISSTDAQNQLQYEPPMALAQNGIRGQEISSLPVASETGTAAGGAVAIVNAPPASNIRSSGRRADANEEADEYNIINTMLRKHPYLRVTTLYMPGASTSKPGTSEIDIGASVSNGVQSTDIVDHGHDRTVRPIDISAPIVRQPRRLSSQKSEPLAAKSKFQSIDKNANVEDDSCSDLLKSLITESGWSEVSSLTLSSRRESLRGPDAPEIERPRSLLFSNGNGSTLNANGNLENGQPTSLSPTTTSNLRLRASMNYMQALQYSVEQIEAAKDITSLVLADQNATSSDRFVEAELAARHWEQQEREIRLTADLQRMRAEMDRMAAAQDLRLTSEMTDNQRRLMETIVATNRHLLEQNRRREERPPLLDATKLAAEVAASAATAATLAALKHGSRTKNASSSASRTTSGTSSLSSAIASSSTEARRNAEAESSEGGAKEWAERRKIEKSPRTVSEIRTASELTNEISSPSKMTSPSSGAVEIQSISAKTVTEAQPSSSRTVTESVPEAGIVSAVDTEKAASMVENRSSQASVIKSDIATQTKELTTTSPTYKTSSSIQEQLSTDSDHHRRSEGTLSEIATVRSASTVSRSTSTADSQAPTVKSISVASTTDDIPSESQSTAIAKKSIMERRRSSETDSEEPSTSPGAAKESMKQLALRKYHLDLDKLAVEDNFSFSMSDLSEHESRVQFLRSSLDDRRRVAEKLKQEYKCRIKAGLEKTEKSLLNQINAYDNFIENTEKQLKDLERTKKNARPSTPPKILSPRHSSEVEIPSSPGRRSTSSSPRSARLQRMTASQRSEKDAKGRLNEFERSATEETPSSEKSEPISSAGSAVSTPRTIASNTAVAPSTKIDEVQSINVELQRKISDDVSEVETDQVATAADLSDTSEKSSGSPTSESADRREISINSKDKSISADHHDGDFVLPDQGTKSTSAEDKQNQSILVDHRDGESILCDQPEEKSVQSDRIEEKSLGSSRTAKSGSESVDDHENRVSSKISISIDQQEAKSPHSTTSISTEIGEDIDSSNATTPRIHGESEKESIDRFPITHISIDQESIGMKISKEELIKTRGSTAADLIVNAVLCDTIEHCLKTWRDQLSKIQRIDYETPKFMTDQLELKRRDEDDHGVAKSINGHQNSEETKIENVIDHRAEIASGDIEARKNRLVDMIVDDEIKSILDDVIRSVLFVDGKRAIGATKESMVEKSITEKTDHRSITQNIDLSSTGHDQKKIMNDQLDNEEEIQKRNETDGVISEKQLENIRRLVSHIDGEDVSPTSSSPRSSKSPRTPPSDRFNEAFREPVKKKGEGQVAMPKPEGDLVLEDEAWMDDDFGLGTADALDTFGLASKSPGSPRSARLDLSKFTTDIFSAVPCSKQSVDTIVDLCVETLNEQRRMGEPLSLSRKPRDLYSVGKEDQDPKEFELSLNRESDRTFRDFLFELCREIVDEVYNEEKGDLWAAIDGEYPKWKKAPRLRFSSYAKLRPRNTEDLQAIVRDAVALHLDSEPEKNKERNSRQKMVSRRKLDRVDQLLLVEMYEEEPDWTVYDEEELRVKFQLADGIWDSVLEEALDRMIRK